MNKLKAWWQNVGKSKRVILIAGACWIVLMLLINWFSNTGNLAGMGILQMIIICGGIAVTVAIAVVIVKIIVTAIKKKKKRN